MVRWSTVILCMCLFNSNNFVKSAGLVCVLLSAILVFFRLASCGGLGYVSAFAHTLVSLKLKLL